MPASFARSFAHSFAARSARTVPGLLLAMCLALTLTPSFAGEVTPRLEQALSAARPQAGATDESWSVWVYFRDKGLRGASLERALDRAEAQLSSRVAWRRAKMKRSGERLVDARDLDLPAAYLAEAKATGAVRRRQSRWLNAASYQATAAQVRLLAALECVDRVDLVAKFSRPELPATPLEEISAELRKGEASRWSVDYGGNLAAMEQFNVPQVHELGITGQGVIIGMLDGGFHPTHECLVDIPVLAAYDFVNDDDNVDNEAGDPDDSRDHGTMTMSTAMGYKPGAHVAPAFGASAILAKTENVSQEVPIEEDQWVAGLEFVEQAGADIVSSSLGYYDWYTYADMDGNSAVTTIAADLAVARGLVVINSAGNERASSWEYIIAPADGDSVIAVGAVTSSGDYSYFSSRGPSYDGRIKPDVAALGSSNHVADPDDDTGYRTASGTSFSCPLTSGVAALVLSRAPQLTPLQVREALRMTASQADSPDNDYGWGLIDALAAVTYFGPVFEHAPLSDTEDLAGPYTLGMTITSRTGLDEATAVVRYRADGGTWQEVPITPTGGGPVTYFAEIPGQPDGTMVDYYLEASSQDGIQTRLPFTAPQEFFSFRVGQDVTAPLLSHTPLADQAFILWPSTVRCEASDNLGLDRVELSFRHNGGFEVGPYALTAQGDDRYALDFPLPVEQVAIGDTISYTLRAFDSAARPNMTTVGPQGFRIIDTLGAVLVLERTEAVATDEKFAADDKSRQPLAPEPGKSSATTLETWLDEAGYLADVIPAEGATAEDLEGYNVVIYAAGDHIDPLGDGSIPALLRGWAAEGGKLVVEGGEVGYDATRTPGHPDFLAEVLHCVDWDTDNAGHLVVGSGMENHPLLNLPHALPASVDIDYDSYGDEDAMEPDGEAYAVMVTASFQGDGGIIVYDDNSAPQSAQIVYLAFNIEALDTTVGRQMSENVLAYLMAPEAPPTSGLAGRVRLAGESDHSGILVDLGNGRSVLTGADGNWSFADLYAGSYTILASKEGWSVARQDLELGEGEVLSDIELTLAPIVDTSYAIYPDLNIPDADPSGVTSVITVPASEAGAVADVSVDIYIQHTWIGDLTVVLTSPQGTSVVLHNRSGAQGINILGNWPDTRPVDGPGSLDDFLGENNAGDWTLFVSDSVGSDAGTLSLWGLNFALPGAVSAVEEGFLPAATRLHAAVPNPFNPRTTIRFDVAGSRQQVRLDIYDLRGRLVRRLVDDTLPAGNHTAVWDGTDERGRGAASGTYLYRLRAGDVVQDRKMLLVR